MQNDAWFFVGIFAFIFLLWIATGGPTRPLSWAGPTLAQPEELGGGTYLGLPRAPFTIGNAEVTLPGSSDGRSNNYQPSTLFGGGRLGGIPYGEESSYSPMVRLNSYVSSAGSDNPRQEFVRLQVAQNASAPITITGWKLVSEMSGKVGFIPRGTRIPTLGIVNAKDDIVLLPGERATVVTGASPIGTSFRENICTGYLDEFQAFTPTLPRTCPVPVEEFERLYGPYYVRDTECVDYLKTIPRCETVTYVPRKVPSSCRQFALQHLNYNGCVVAHRDDVNFSGNSWRIYLGLSDSMWRGRTEIVKLLDHTNKTVSAFRY